MDASFKTVRTLLIAIGSLLRKHPVLVLPVLTADTLSFAAMHLQHALHDPLLSLFFGHRDSVLGSSRTSFVLTPKNASEAFWLLAPLIWGCYLLTIYLYTTALVFTAGQVDDAMTGKSPSLSFAVVASNIQKARLVRFSLLVFVFAIMGAGADAFLLYISMKIPWLAHRMGADLGYVIGMLVELTALYFLVKPAIRVLRSREINTMHHLHRIGAIFCSAFVLMQGLELLVIDHVLPASLFQQRTIMGLLFREWVVSLAGALLYVPLFIGLSLLSETLASSPQGSLGQLAEEAGL
jgi:hypothetical protein